MKRFQKPNLINKQRGAALLILAVILILTVTLIMVGKHSRNADKLQSEAGVHKLLADAKEAIIAIAVSHPTNPGVLPYPDRVGGGGFDGGGDCNGQTAVNLPLRVITLNNPLLGRFPYLNQAAGGGGCTQIRIAHNVSNSRYPLHYAVSENLVQYNVLDVPSATNITNNINSNVLNEPDVAGAPSGWLTVYDGNGAILNNRVAFIVFYPGAQLPGQNRAPVSANSAQYLESFNVPGIGIVNNSNPIPGNYVAANETATFNDKLVFVTVDDLMRRVEAAILRMVVVTSPLNRPYPAALPLSNAALIAARPELINWLSPGINNYDNWIDLPFGGTGYNRLITTFTYTRGVDCNGNPSVPANATASLRANLQCLTLR